MAGRYRRFPILPVAFFLRVQVYWQHLPGRICCGPCLCADNCIYVHFVPPYGLGPPHPALSGQRSGWDVTANTGIA